ncbi:hypothetical protein PENSPDRAFT_25100 [Peniophora sp. CONT]|nr:hypothetical protein PENSPDRAFT_25100 [Peniophora sp. CONT]
MNSYPPELLAQLAPVMFVAGLDVQTPPAETVTTGSGESQRAQMDPFDVLSIRLRDALIAQRKPATWQPDKSKTFQAILVDKEVRFPPRKIAPSNDLSHSQVYHSPLSPLTPTSPLHPDGIIAPIWVRKHTQLVPSVFVLFTRIYESPPAHLPRSPLDPPHPDKETEERRRDAELAGEIAGRKKSTGERGIKLTVVLLASRRMLDDPTLDSRLSFIRRQSGLDSRAALFVLSPVSAAELSEFIKSLQQALYDPAVEYYTSHSKRVRRKRNRHAQTGGYTAPLPPLASTQARPLRSEGWTVRYEYKMACFAEFRGEDEVALKHYQDAYSVLILMFGSAAMLPPRTKRWAEAKVLADTINIKICKLYLYNNEHSLALSQHNAHMRKFGDFSRGWGIGEETFEFWSWIARQHRVFAELLEQGSRSTLQIPTHIPTTSALHAQAAQVDESMRVLGLNPANALQHPGFFYYLAAAAAEKRRARFMIIDQAGPQAVANAPGYTNEKKIDHLAVIQELYTKSYELFKKHSPANAQGTGRLILRIALRIAQTYYDAGKFDMAVRFFERIAKTYRKENWGGMLRPLLGTWFRCAQMLGDVELSVRLLVEMLAYGRDGDEEEESIAEDLLAVLKNTMPTNPDESLIIDLTDARPILDSSVVFWKATAVVNENVAFQISLTSPANVPLTPLTFDSLLVHFSHREEPVVVRHSAEEGDAVVRRVDVGEVLAESEVQEVDGQLRWDAGQTLVCSGTVASEEPMDIKIDKVILRLKEGSWTVDIPVDVTRSSEETVTSSLWYTSIDPPSTTPILRADVSQVTIHHKPHQVEVSFDHPSPAYLDEEYPIVVNVLNSDERSFDAVLDVLLQPTEIDDAVNTIRIDEERSSGLVKDISLGQIPPNSTSSKTIYLHNTGAPGPRILDVSIRSYVSHRETDSAETLRILSVPVSAPVKVKHDVRYVRSRKRVPKLTDLSAYDADFWDDGLGGEAFVSVGFGCEGPHGIEVESVWLVREEGPNARVVGCSLDADGSDLVSEWLPGDEFAAITRVSMMVEEDSDPSEPIPGPGYYELKWKRLQQDDATTCTSIFKLPSLIPPRDGLIALLSLPASAKLHASAPAELTVRNLHNSRTADVHISLETDATDGLLVAGPRISRIPALLPGQEIRLAWSLLPLECGRIRAPRIRVVDRRKRMVDGVMPAVEDEGVLVRVVDLRRDSYDERGEEKSVTRIEDEVARATDSSGEAFAVGPILVLP